MPAAIESGVGRTWAANQSALGTKALVSATSTISLRQATDDVLTHNKKHGQEPYVDGAAYDSSTPYVENVGGDVGQLVTQAQIETGAALIARSVGVDVVTGASDPYTHTISSGTANPTYQTIHQSVGVNVGPFKAVWWDAILSKVTFNCGQDQNVAHLAAGVMALKAAEIVTALPTANDSGTDPYRWGEAAGALTIGGTPFTEIAGETVDADRGWDVHMGDATEPSCFVPGRGKIMRTFSTLVTDNMLAQLLNLLYGSSTPTAGTRPTSQPSYGALVSTYTRSATRTLKFDTGKVELRPDDIVIGAKPEGGKREVTFGGQALANGATSALIVTAKTGDASSYIV